jgi:hypothetical protein
MVKIYTFSDKRPDFISLQYEYFQKFLKDEHYEFIVCNNGSSSSLSHQIEEACAKNNLTCVEIDKDFTDPATACAVPINSALHKYIRNDDPENLSVIIDSDIFLFAPFSFERYMLDHDIAGIMQQREKRGLFNLTKTNYVYLWNALIIFRNKNLAFDDFDVSVIQGLTDVGGSLYHYLNKHKPKVKWMTHTPDIEQEERVIFDMAVQESYDPVFGMQIIENAFIHYYRGSNWDNNPVQFHQQKTAFLLQFLQLAEHHSPLNLRDADAFNHSSAHIQKHYNGIRNNTRVFKPKDAF